MTAEEWRTIASAPAYEVSNLGRVRRGDYIKAQTVLSVGYRSVRLYDKTEYVHKLVLTSFVGPRPAGMVCRHLDGNPLNNALDNLRWGTRRENLEDSVRHGTHQHAAKTHCPAGHPYDEANTQIVRTATRVNRQCRACKNAWSRARRAARKVAA